MVQVSIRMINKMKVNIWVAIIVLLVGLWDLYTAYNRYQKNKKSRIDNTAGTKKSITGIPSDRKVNVFSFTILGIVFTITGIILFFMI